MLSNFSPGDNSMDMDSQQPKAANGHLAEEGAPPAKEQLLFCERFVEFMIDLMSQAPTRRYTHAFLEDRAVLIKCRMSELFNSEQGRALGMPPRHVMCDR